MIRETQEAQGILNETRTITIIQGKTQTAPSFKIPMGLSMMDLDRMEEGPIQRERGPKEMRIGPPEAPDHKHQEEMRADNNGQVEETGHQINP